MALFVEWVFILGALQGLFIIGVFLAQNGFSRVNLWFSFLIYFFSMICLSRYLFIRGLPFDSPLWLPFILIPRFLLGPFFFLYVSSLLGDEGIFSRFWGVHFLPALADLIYDLGLLHFGKLSVEAQIFDASIFYYFLEDSHSFFYFLFAVVLVVRRIRNHEMRSSINLHLGFLWLIFLFLLTGLYTGTFFVQNLVLLMGTGIDLFFSPFFLIPVLILCLSWFFLAKARLITGELQTVGVRSENSDYGLNRLSQTEIDLLKEKVDRLIIREKLYRQPGITLAEVAEELGVPLYKVSQTINRQTSGSFLKYINQFRVEEMKVLLLDTDRTVLDIGMDVGFNSKSSINRVFHDETGVSPSAFRKAGRFSGG